MIQGTGSSVGKSVLVAGLARLLARRGLRVRPFKPQNMSNNAAVTADGGEIGRAQALQALACGVAPSVHMNPVLLKPQSQTGAQIVVQGRVAGHARARDYQARKPALLPFVLDSFRRLSDEADIVLVEGAGSASEINLRAGDIANMGFAEAAGVPVVVAGDIDRGGVIASLVGTAAVLPPADRDRIRGFLVNRMRGDASLFAAGMEAIARHTGWPALGLVPFCDAVRRLPAEDAADLGRDAGQWRPVATGAADGSGGQRLHVCVPLLPHISNFDDLDPLRAEPGVWLEMLPRGRALPATCDLVILPGSKSTAADLAVLRAEGWHHDILAHHRRGGSVLGLCGGYQMLGTSIADPGGVEGPAGEMQGLGLLAMRTEMGGTKRLEQEEGLLLPENAAVRGYRMHMGRTDGAALDRPLLRLRGGPDGAVSPDGRVMGTYLHGLLDAAPGRAALLARLGARGGGHDQAALVEAALDEWADHLARHLDVEAMLAIAATRPGL
ncbi:cobyric acid synthase [Rhizosaccharibacter radicis]